MTIFSKIYNHYSKNKYKLLKYLVLGGLIAGTGVMTYKWNERGKSIEILNKANEVLNKEIEVLKKNEERLIKIETKITKLEEVKNVMDRMLIQLRDDYNERIIDKKLEITKYTEQLEKKNQEFIELQTKYNRLIENIRYLENNKTILHTSNILNYLLYITKRIEIFDITKYINFKNSFIRKKLEEYYKDDKLNNILEKIKLYNNNIKNLITKIHKKFEILDTLDKYVVSITEIDILNDFKEDFDYFIDIFDTLVKIFENKNHNDELLEDYIRAMHSDVIYGKKLITGEIEGEGTKQFGKKTRRLRKTYKSIKTRRSRKTRKSRKIRKSRKTRRSRKKIHKKHTKLNKSRNF